jgi:antitoxin component of RelBE/YafQ-DinJ toxin-antitoxin module
MEARKQKELISIRATTKFKNQLQKIADKKGMTLPALVRYILMQYMENESNNEEDEDN